MLGARWSRAELVSASSQTPHLAEDWCVDNYWSTVVAAAVVVVTVSAVVVLPDAGAGGMLLRLCWRACARSARPGTGQPLTLGSSRQCAAAGPRQSSDTVIVTLHQHQHRSVLSQYWGQTCDPCWAASYGLHLFELPFITNNVLLEELGSPNPTIHTCLNI